MQKACGLVVHVGVCDQVDSGLSTQIALEYSSFLEVEGNTVTRRALNDTIWDSSTTQNLQEVLHEWNDADTIMVVYTTRLGTTPSELKKYIEIVAEGVSSGLVSNTDKKVSIVILEPKNHIEAELVYANREGHFWQRVVFPLCKVEGKVKRHYSVREQDPVYVGQLITRLAASWVV